jgi:hypothetical protein
MGVECPPKDEVMGICRLGKLSDLVKALRERGSYHHGLWNIRLDIGDSPKSHNNLHKCRIRFDRAILDKRGKSYCGRHPLNVEAVLKERTLSEFANLARFLHTLKLMGNPCRGPTSWPVSCKC